MIHVIAKKKVCFVERQTNKDLVYVFFITCCLILSFVAAFIFVMCLKKMMTIKYARYNARYPLVHNVVSKSIQCP